MTMHILLSAANRAQVEAGNPYLRGSQLRPVLRQGSVYILNAAVLSDPDFVAAKAFLLTLPQKDSAAGDFPLPMPDPT